MAKPAQRKLKVFQAQIGFFDTVVAAPSRAAALRAWGIHQDLFASGQAQIAVDPQAVEVALAHPETPLKRAVGTADAFGLESRNLPTVPDAPKRPADKPKTKAIRATSRKPAADRSALDAAEAVLRSLDDDRRQEETAFRHRQDLLDAAREAAQAVYVENQKSAAAAIAKARAANRKAGGEV